jgi:hypothetical protein
MVTVRLSFLVLLMVFTTSTRFAQRQPARRVSNARWIGNVTKVADSCGCYFRLAGEDRNSERYVFFEDASEKAPLMNIDGRNVKLKLLSSIEPAGGVSRRGERFSRNYAAGNVRVRMYFVASSVCPGPYDPECLGNRYDVTLVVTKGTRRQTIKALGGCGC